MSEAGAENTKQPDPTEKFRELRDAYLAIWSRNLIETVNSEGYAKASGAALDGILAVAAPLKEPTEQMMLKTLQQLNMPTSADFAGLAGRFTNIELVLDNLDAKIDRIERLLTGAKAATSEKTKVPTESAAHGPEVDQDNALSPKTEELANTATTARNSAPKKQTALRTRKPLKQTATVKQVGRIPRKGIR